MIVFLLWGAPKKFSNFNVGETVYRVFWQDIANLPISPWQKCIQHEGNHQLVLLRTPLDLHGLLAGNKTIYLKEFDHMIHQPEIIWVWMIAKRSAAEVFCVFAFHAKLSRTMLSREWWVLKSEKSKSRRPAVRHCRRPAVLATSAQALQPGHMLHCPQEASCLRCSRWHCGSTGACICRLHTSGNVRDKQLGRPHLIARELSIRPSSHILMGSLSDQTSCHLPNFCEHIRQLQLLDIRPVGEDLTNSNTPFRMSFGVAYTQITRSGKGPCIQYLYTHTYVIDLTLRWLEKYGSKVPKVPIVTLTRRSNWVTSPTNPLDPKIPMEKWRFQLTKIWVIAPKTWRKRGFPWMRHMISRKFLFFLDDPQWILPALELWPW